MVHCSVPGSDVLCVAGDQPGAHTGAAHRGLDRGRGPGHSQPPGQPRPAGTDPRQVSGMAMLYNPSL